MASRCLHVSAGSILATGRSGWLWLPAALALAVGVPAAAEPAEPAETAILAQAETPPDEEVPAAPEGTPTEAAPEPAPPKGTPPPPSGVEVIRIKGRPLSAIETEVPESATQFDAAAIEALGAQNVSDLAKVTPNVEIRSAGSTQATFFVRGVGLSDFSSNAAGAVAIYQDEVAINAPAMQIGQLFDIENVEVLRGPVGTGSGYNASAGAIKVVSRKPTGEYSASMRSSFGTYLSDDAESDALIQDYEGAVEVPLIDEMLSTRLAFRFQTADPYMTNGCGGVDVPLDDRIADPVPWRGVRFCSEKATLLVPNPTGPGQVRISPLEAGLADLVGDQGQWAARGGLRFQPPGQDMDWLLMVRGARTDQQSTLGQAMGTGAQGNNLGGITRENYTEPDQAAELDAIVADLVAQGHPCLPSPPQCSALRRDVAFPILGKRLASGRPLDLGPYRGDYNRVGRTTLDTWGASLRGDIPIGPVNFTTISGYDTYERFRDTDNDFTPDVLFETVTTDDAWQYFQELRVGGELSDTPLRWDLGGFYLMEELHTFSELRTFIEFSNVDREFTQDLWSFAFYGEFGWDFLDDFTLEGGSATTGPARISTSRRSPRPARPMRFRRRPGRLRPASSA